MLSLRLFIVTGIVPLPKCTNCGFIGSGNGIEYFDRLKSQVSLQ